MLQDLSCYLVDVADDTGGSQVPAALLAGQILEDFFCTQVKSGAEHLLAALCTVTMITWWIRNAKLNILFILAGLISNESCGFTLSRAAIVQ